MSWLLHDGPQTCSGSELVVALVLAEHASGENGIAYPSVGRIARMSRLSERQTTRVLATLVEQKVIEAAWPATNRRPTGYRFIGFRADIRVTPGNKLEVTREVPGGDIQGIPEVTSMSPELYVRERNVELLTLETTSLDKPFQMWAAFCEETKQDYTKATRQAKGYALAACKQLIADGITADEVRAFVRFRTTTWKNDAVIRMSDVVREIGEWRMAGEPSVDNAPRPAVHKNGNKGLSPRELLKAADHMAASGSDVHDAFSYIKGTK